MHINSHNEAVYRDGEEREEHMVGYQGTCPACGRDRGVCYDCTCWLACECGEPADCRCTGEDETAEIPAETMAEMISKGKGDRT